MTDTLRILVPIDGSDAARRALMHVIELARRGLAVDVHLLNVQPAVRGMSASLVSHHDLAGYHRDEGMRALAESIRLVDAAGLELHEHIAVGDPGETVLTFARRLHCGQIVMGTHARGGMTEVLLGSVSQHVVRHADVPVTLLR